MADNFTSDPASGGQTFASDDIGGVQYPIGKLAFGALDSVTLVSAANALPITGALTDTQLRATPVPVSAVDLHTTPFKTTAS